MSGIFTILQNFDGVRFSQEIIEPPIPSVEAAKEEQQAPQRVLRVIIFFSLFLIVDNILIFCLKFI